MSSNRFSHFPCIFQAQHGLYLIASEQEVNVAMLRTDFDQHQNSAIAHIKLFLNKLYVRIARQSSEQQSGSKLFAKVTEWLIIYTAGQ